MQKKKARKGFLFLRRESVLPPCRAGPVCPAGTNAVFCGGTHGSRPTDRCGKPSVGDGVLQWSAAEQMPLGYDVPSARQRRAAFGRTALSAPAHLVIASQSAPRSKCPWGTDWRGNPFPQRSPLDKPAGMGIIINTRGRCDKRSALSSKDLHQGFTPQKKPSLGRVAVSSFQLLYSDRD